MEKSTTKNLMCATAAAFAVAVTFVTGCAQHSNSDGSSASASYQALGSQLQNCVSTALTCLKSANCDPAKDQACRDDFKACHDGNKAIFEAFHQSVQQCVEARRTCVADAGAQAPAGSPSATAWNTFIACKQQYRACIDDSRPIAPPPGPCMQGLRQCVQEGTQSGAQCFQQARTCFMNELPPVCGGTGGTGGTMMGGMTGAGGTGGA
jgi:hypothetical protein